MQNLHKYTPASAIETLHRESAAYWIGNGDMSSVPFFRPTMRTKIFRNGKKGKYVLTG
jgi:hypothetical protein